jgi:hypothetical protein
MSDTWLIVEASFPNLDKRDIILIFVKPIIEEFQNDIHTFHFFFEPYLLLRIKADENSTMEKIKPYVEEKLSKLNVTNQSVRMEPGYTEEPDYGEGWKIAQEIFELGSRSAILKAESDVGNVRLGSQFNEVKFMHLLLNEWGYSVDKEAHLHLKVVGERLAMVHLRFNIELVNQKLPRILKELEDTFFTKIDEVVSRIITEP